MEHMEYTLETVISCEKYVLADIARFGINGGKDVHEAILALLEELKAYRETGLTPEQVKELEDKHWSECRQIAQYSDLWKPYPDCVPLSGQEVIVQLKNEHICCASYDAEEPAAFIDDNRNFISAHDVVAWMPMPERYKGKNEK